MRKLLALLASTALLATGFAAPAHAAGGQGCDEGIFSDTWLCATVSLPDTVQLSSKNQVSLDIAVDYTASDTFTLDAENWVRITSETTGTIWVFDLTPVSSTRDELTLTLAPELAPGRYSIDLYASADVDYYDEYWGYDDEWLYIAEHDVASFTVKSPPKTPETPKPAPKKAAKTYAKLSASAKKVSYNKKVTLKGSVVYGADRKPLKNKKLTVHFDPDGEAPKKKVGTVKTNSKGTFSKAFRQKVPGKWTVTWKGNSSYKKTSKSVSTKVKPTKYKNCTALNKDYPGGVARSSGAAWDAWEKHEPFVFKSLYSKNKKLDRDKDGVACER